MKPAAWLRDMGRSSNSGTASDIPPNPPYLNLRDERLAYSKALSQMGLRLKTTQTPDFQYLCLSQSGISILLPFGIA
jgi:hypothetical protein